LVVGFPELMTCACGYCHC